jgi:SAM-dependent methyltransferase
MDFVGDLAAIQRRTAQTADLLARRRTVLDALAPKPGEHILEIGCGGGAYVSEAARAVGESGRVCGLDISADQISAARTLCSGQSNVRFDVADALSVPYGDASFDAVFSVQVLEYLTDVDLAISEIARLLKPTGRCVILATNWGSVFWTGADPDLTERMLRAWDHHAAHANLAVGLPKRLTAAGFDEVSQQPVAILNNAYDENLFSYWAARIFADYCRKCGAVSDNEIARWFADLETASLEGRYFFSSTPVLTRAARAV